MIQQYEITLPSMGRGYHLITHIIEKSIEEMPEKGLLNILLKHTSAAITMNENADPSVRDDFESFFNRLAPENASYFTHVLEGSDDMPAHLKSSILGQEITIPISNKRLNLGTWQGIYYCEFRNHSSRRKIVLTIYS
jgi:secondary thiamine-phosphate synthase enzyme